MPDIEQLAKEVRAEVEKLGSIPKELENIKKGFEEVKKLVNENSNDPLAKDKLDKFTTDITARQEAVDTKLTVIEKAANDRMDQIEVAAKKHGKALPEDIRKEQESLDKFNLMRKSKGMNNDIGMEEYIDYKNAVNAYFRTKDEKMLSPENLKALQVGVDPNGGYTVFPEISSQMEMRLFESDPIRQLASVQGISTDALEMIEDYDELNVGWEGETAANGETSTPKFNKIRISTDTMAARPRATQTLLDDSSINIESWLSNKLADKFGRFESAAFVSGDGVSKPRGFLTYNNYTTAGTDEFGKIEQIPVGTPANTIDADKLINMRYSLIEQYLNRGTWLMNRLTVRDILKLKDGMGNYLWQPGLSANSPSMLLGLPVRMSTTMPTVAANALSLALADWASAYQIVDRIGMYILRDPYTQKPFVEFYTRRRVGGAVKNFQSIKIGKIATA